MNSDLEIFFKALGNDRRLFILSYIYKHEHVSVYDIANELGISEQAASTHLKKLERARIIKQKREGEYVLSSAIFASQQLPIRKPPLINFLRDHSG
jgi:DNA-binding transcriptional ArsR family regulator